MRADDLPERTPPDAGPPTDAGHVSLHTVLVRGGDAHFARDAGQSPSDVESGTEAVADARAIERPERWWRIWIAVVHERDGTRSYRGAAAAEILVDPIARKSFRDRDRDDTALEAALRGGVELDGLDETERASLRTALVHEDPDAWEGAPAHLQRALARAERKEQSS